MKKKNNRKYSNDFILIGVVAGLVALLDYIGVITFPIGLIGTSSAFYIGAAFFAAFAIWFKWKGLVSIYIGLLIGAIISGTFTVFVFILALGNVIGAAMVLIIFKFGKFDPALKSTKDYIAYIAGSTFLQSILSAVWTIGGLYLFGIIPYSGIYLALFGWIIGDMVVSLVIGIPLLKAVSPVIKKTSLYSN